ncbi:peptidoglycan DD-metalloendopeptidase family protein [Patescibacteria group bacterium]|nr:peptidoglycan DD-metalloendopeptidase family protein [Patescibacteria group bacterium]MBU1727847.1 peptidoglycan DD-metalloendopeptidase family protein [Patescibacteria group bacterium]
MKLYHDYKKQFRLVILGLLIIVPIAFSCAQTAEELKAKINQKNEDIVKLEQEIKKYQTQLNDLGKQKSSLNSSIQQLDLTRKKLIADISITENKIEKTNLKIQELSLDINNKEDLIDTDKEAIKLGIRQTNESELNNFMQIILSENNFTEIWNDIEDMASVRETIREKIVDLKQVKSDLEDTRQETTNARNELVSLKNKLADQKKIVDQNTVEKKKLLTQTKNSEANYQKLLKENQAKIAVFEKELEDYEAQLKYILDPSVLPGKGVLSWPLDYVYITSHFGPRNVKGISSFHKGIDFRASVGTPVKAMADGVVAGTGDTDVQCPGVSYGRFVLIKYNNGLAGTYAHLSLIKVSKGDTIKRGQIIGYSGNTGSSTGPHLHISVYPRDAVDVKTLPSKSCPGRVLTQPIAATNAYLKPLDYLPPYK